MVRNSAISCPGQPRRTRRCGGQEAPGWSSPSSCRWARPQTGPGSSGIFWVDFIGGPSTKIKESARHPGAGRAPTTCWGRTNPMRRAKDGRRSRQCPNLRPPAKLNLKGREIRRPSSAATNYPECRYTRPLAADSGKPAPDRLLGKDPVSDLDVVVKAGRFSVPIFQLGEPKDYAGRRKTPKRRGYSQKHVARRYRTRGWHWKLLSLAARKSANIRKTGRTDHPRGSVGSAPFVRHEKPTPSLEGRRRGCSISGSTGQSPLIAEKILKGPSGPAPLRWPIPAKAVGRSSRRFGGRSTPVKGRTLRALGAYVTAGGRQTPRSPSEQDGRKTIHPRKKAIALIDERVAKGGGKAEAAAPRKQNPAQACQGQGRKPGQKFEADAKRRPRPANKPA